VKGERQGVEMLQKNHHFLFPQTYFGSFEDIEDALFDEEDDEEEDVSHVPWVLILEPDKMNQYDTKIGLYIHWIDHTQL
jgi:hypothetical protein